MGLSFNKQLYLFGGLLLVAAAGYGLAGANALEPAPTSEPVLRPIKTVKAQVSTSHFERSFPGKVRSGKRVNLAFSVPGVIEYLDANEGSLIKKGSVIARLDPRDHRYRFNSAKARYEQSKNELARLDYLLGKQLISQTRFDQQQADFEIALAAFEASRKALADTVLMAPFDGVIAKRYLENGEHIQADQTIISLQDISDIEIVIQVPEKFIANESHLNSAGFSVQLNVEQSHWFPAKVIEHSIESSLEANTYDVVVAMDAIEGMAIYPGMTAQVRVSAMLPLSEGRKQIALPADAVLVDPAGNAFVWVIPAEGGLPEKRKVQLDDFHADGVIVSSGLQGGEQIAISGLHTITAAQPLRPMAAGAEGLDG